LLLRVYGCARPLPLAGLLLLSEKMEINTEKQPRSQTLSEESKIILL
jgi:hypothetical protein